MKMVLRGMLLTCVLVTLTGCGGISGHWTLDSIEPDSAQKAFPIARLCLHEDHTYAASMACGSKMNGTWEYDADAKLLTFTTAKGTKRVYEARVCGVGGKLLVKSTDASKEWKASMKRDKCHGDEENCDKKI